MKPELYFIGSISSGDTIFAETRKRIFREMQNHGKVLDEHVIRDDAKELEEAQSKLGINIYTRDTGWLDRSVAAVAEISSPTTGGGGEIQRFALQGKPLLVLRDANTRGSWFVNQMPDVMPHVEHFAYESPEEAVSRVGSFLSKIPKRPMEGKFIVMEGPDYSGKGTQHRRMISYLLDHPLDRSSKAINVVATREPYNTIIQEKIRRQLREGTNPEDLAQQMAQWYTADRAIHVHTCILPSLARGDLVASDRYKYSTEAYQAAQGVPLEDLLKMHQNMPVPDLAIILQVPLNEQLKRKSLERNRPFEEIFEKDSDFMGQVALNYSRMKEIHPDDNIVYVDGTGSSDEVFSRIRPYVDAIVFQDPV